MTDRGQAFTLEALAAGLVLLVGLAVAVQAASVTPLSASTANRQADHQLGGDVGGLLDDLAAENELRPSLLYWNESNETFFESSEDGYYANESLPTALGTELNRTYGGRSVVYNVHLRYVYDGDDVETPTPHTRWLVHQGTPGDDAVTAARSVTLYDDDVLLNRSQRATNVTVAQAAANGTFYAPDAAPDRPVFNVVRVEVTVWRS